MEALSVPCYVIVSSHGSTSKYANYSANFLLSVRDIFMRSSSKHKVSFRVTIEQFYRNRDIVIKQISQQLSFLFAFASNNTFYPARLDFINKKMMNILYYKFIKFNAYNPLIIINH
jgi:hypothetical protein